MRMIRSAAILILLPCLVGCSTAIPNLRPYRDATANLADATNAVYDAAQASVNNRLILAERLPEHDSSKAALVTELKGQAAQLDKSVKIRKKVMTAFVAYTDRLVNIAESAANEQKKVDEAVNAANELLESVKILVPTSSVAPAAGLTEQIAGLIGDGIKAVEQMRASKTIAEAISKAGIAVSRFSAAMALDLADMQGIIKLEPVEVEALMQKVYQEELGTVMKKIRLQRQRAIKTLNDAEIVTAKDIDAIYEQDQLAARARGLMGGGEIDAASSRAKVGLACIANVRAAMTEWSETHEKIAVAIRGGWQPDLKSLADSVAEVSQRVAELHKAEEAIEVLRSQHTDR